MNRVADGWTAPGSGDPAAGPAGEAVPWDQISDRVTAYLYALGITEAFHRELLGTRIRGRLQARLTDAQVEDPLEAAIEEVDALLDEWLDTELGMVGDRQLLVGARAAVLSGAVPGWAARFSGAAGESVAEAIRAAGVTPVPEAAPLAMEPSQIRLCRHSLGQRIVARLRRWVCGAERANSHP